MPPSRHHKFERCLIFTLLRAQLREKLSHTDQNLPLATASLGDGIGGHLRLLKYIHDHRRNRAIIRNISQQRDQRSGGKASNNATQSSCRSVDDRKTLGTLLRPGRPQSSTYQLSLSDPPIAQYCQTRGRICLCSTDVAATQHTHWQGTERLVLM